MTAKNYILPQSLRMVKKKKKKAYIFSPEDNFTRQPLTDVLNDDKFMTMSDSIIWNRASLCYNTWSRSDLF